MQKALAKAASDAAWDANEAKAESFILKAGDALSEEDKEAVRSRFRKKHTQQMREAAEQQTSQSEADVASSNKIASASVRQRRSGMTAATFVAQMPSADDQAKLAREQELAAMNPWQAQRTAAEAKAEQRRLKLAAAKLSLSSKKTKGMEALQRFKSPARERDADEPSPERLKAKLAGFAARVSPSRRRGAERDALFKMRTTPAEAARQAAAQEAKPLPAWMSMVSAEAEEQAKTRYKEQQRFEREEREQEETRLAGRSKHSVFAGGT